MSHPVAPTPPAGRRRRPASHRVTRSTLAALALASAVPAAGTLAAGSFAALATPALAATTPVPSMAPFVGTQAEFYAQPPAPAPPPATQPAHGTLIRYQATTGTRLRIMYWTIQPILKNGQTTYTTVAATALVNRPTVARPAEGFPVLAFTHGTVGMMVDCAPSNHTMFWPDFMLPATAYTVAPDYIGLGTDPLVRSADAAHTFSFVGATVTPFDTTSHPYLSREGSGRATLDSIIATRALERALGPVGETPDPDRGSIVVGLSEGGHAALSTGEVQADNYAPDVDLKAIVAGAPPSEFDLAKYPESALRNGIPRLAVSLSLANKDVHPADFLSDQGKWRYDQSFDKTCPANPLFSIVPSVSSGSPLKPGITAADLKDPAKQPAMAAAFKAIELGTKRINTPILISQGIADPEVIAEVTDRLATRLRSTGSDVTYCKFAPDFAASLVPSLNHLDAVTRAWSGGATCTNPNDSADVTAASTNLWTWLKRQGGGFTKAK